VESNITLFSRAHAIEKAAHRPMSKEMIHRNKTSIPVAKPLIAQLPP
jgi:hypothetical protein